MLTSINDVKNFVSIANDQSYEIDLVSGRYIIDAKSIMGIFSLDLTKPIRVEIHASDGESAAFANLVKEYMV
jgi:phosphotransferase system HPr-like phosphotransfer protein